MYRNYITWEQSFKEVNESILRHEIIISITNEMFNGDFNNLSTFTNDQKEEVWNNYYNTTELCE
jgi:hypothetical protein